MRRLLISGILTCAFIAASARAESSGVEVQRSEAAILLMLSSQQTDTSATVVNQTTSAYDLDEKLRLQVHRQIRFNYPGNEEARYTLTIHGLDGVVKVQPIEKSEYEEINAVLSTLPRARSLDYALADCFVVANIKNNKISQFTSACARK